MEKEKWKDDVLNSLAGIKPAEPNAFLFTRIEARLAQTSGLSRLQVRLAGVGMVVLLIVNIWIAASGGSITQENNSLTTTYRY